MCGCARYKPSILRLLSKSSGALPNLSKFSNFPKFPTNCAPGYSQLFLVFLSLS